MRRIVKESGYLHDVNEAFYGDLTRPTQGRVFGCARIDPGRLSKPIGFSICAASSDWRPSTAGTLEKRRTPIPLPLRARCPGQVADWVPVTNRITVNNINPALDAAGNAGIGVWQYGIAQRHMTCTQCYGAIG